MLERLRFARYALAFERAFENDDGWAVKAHFHSNGSHVIDGTGTSFDGGDRGRDAVARVFRDRRGHPSLGIRR